MKKTNNTLALETIESGKNKLPWGKSLVKTPYYPLVLPKEDNKTTSNPEKSASTQPKNQTVFCIDDSKTTQLLVKQFLSKAGYKVIGNTNPLKSLMLLLQHKPDIIIIDIKMPGIGGYELLKIIKSSPKLKNIPAIMLTSQTREFDRIRAKLLGAEAYITKPFSHEGLVTVVDRVLTKTTASC